MSLTMLMIQPALRVVIVILFPVLRLVMVMSCKQQVQKWKLHCGIHY